MVLANDVFLEDLQVLNGELSPTFTKMNNKYTIELETGEEEVLFKYTVNDGISVSVQNNSNLKDNSIVTIDLIQNNVVVVSYEFNILMETNTTSVFNEIKNEEVEVGNIEFMQKHKNIIIPISAALLIALSFKIIFFGIKKKSI